MALDEPKETDQVFAINGMTYLVDSNLSKEVTFVKVDYVQTAYGQGFSITSDLQGCAEGCSC